MSVAPIEPNIPLGHSYLIGQGPMHDQATIDMVRRVGQHPGDVVLWAQGDPTFNARRIANDVAAQEAAAIGNIIASFFLVAAGQAGGFGYYTNQLSFVLACLQCMSNFGALPTDVESMGDSTQPWGAVNHRRIWYYAVDWSAASDADHYATAHVDPDNYGKFLTMGFVCMVQDASSGSWSLFREGGTTGFYRQIGPTNFEKDFSLDNWFKDNAATIYDAEVQVIGAVLDIYTAGAGTVLADIMETVMKEAKPLLVAISSGNSAGALTAVADIASSVVAAAPAAIAILKDAAPGTFAFVATVGDDIKRVWEQTNKVLGGAVDSIEDIATFGPEMAVQASKLAFSAGGSLAARGGALLQGLPLDGISGTIDGAYLSKARAAAGVGGYWFDHGWNLDLTSIKMLDTNVAGYQQKIEDTIRQSCADQLAGAPWYAQTYVAHGAVVSVMQAAQQGMLVPDPQLKGITQQIVAYQAGYVPPELQAATASQIQSATTSAKNGAIQDASSHAVQPSATITVPGTSTATIVAGIAGASVIAGGLYWYLRTPRRGNPRRRRRKNPPIPWWLIGLGLGGTVVAVAAAASAATPASKAVPPPPSPSHPGGTPNFSTGGMMMISPSANPNAAYEGAATGPSSTNLAVLMDLTHQFTVGEVQFLLKLWALSPQRASFGYAPLDAATIATISAMRSDGVWDDGTTQAVRAFQLKGMGYQGANIVQGDPFDNQTSAALHQVAIAFANTGL